MLYRLITCATIAALALASSAQAGKCDTSDKVGVISAGYNENQPDFGEGEQLWITTVYERTNYFPVTSLEVRVMKCLDGSYLSSHPQKKGRYILWVRTKKQQNEWLDHLETFKKQKPRDVSPPEKPESWQ